MNFVGLMISAARRTGASCSSRSGSGPAGPRAPTTRGAVTAGATRFITNSPMTNASTTIPVMIQGR